MMIIVRTIINIVSTSTPAAADTPVYTCSVRNNISEQCNEACNLTIIISLIFRNPFKYQCYIYAYLFIKMLVQQCIICLV